MPPTILHKSISASGSFARTTKSRNNLSRPSFSNPTAATMRRRSACSSIAANSHHVKSIWRSPGHYEAPDILGRAYLKPELPTSFDLRPSDPSKHVSNRPWYPPNPFYEIPQLPPLERKQQSEFERKLRKVLPKLRISTSDPRRRYDQFQEIGTGVNGAVISACYRKKPTIHVAIKRCVLHNDPAYRTAILRELRIMATRHPNLIRLREVVIWHDDLWMTMDLMHCSVFTVLCQCGIPENHAVYITCETLKALIYLHGMGYLHRDVKCENILLGPDGQVKLADFGLSAPIKRQNRERLGTSKWMAPELIREEVYNESIDMWSLGITIIEMTDRVPPHYLIKNEDELFDIITTQPGPTFTYSYPSIYMRGLVAWLLDENPRSRPSAQDVLLELEMHINTRLLPCSSAAELARFLKQVLPIE